MSVIMIIVGSLVTALLAIGIVGGVILSIVSVVRLVSGRGNINGKTVGKGYRFWISGICMLNAVALLVGGYFGIKAFQNNKDKIVQAIEQQSEKDDILPDFLQDENVTEK